VIGGSRRPVWLAGVLDPDDALGRLAFADLALADIATAQELTDRIGRLDRIDLLMPDADAAAIDSIRSVMPAGVRIVSAAARTRSTAGMTRAFELDLGAFTLITLAFGALLIFDVMTFSVVQRRSLIGQLRALGVTRREILRVVLGEALMIGLAGTMLGIILGVALATGLIRLVVRTINDLYFSVTVSGVTLRSVTLLKAGALGVAATVAASLPAIREATTAQPRAVLLRSVLEARVRSVVFRTATAGLFLLLPSILLATLPSDSVVLGFVALFGVVAAAALLAPAGTVCLMRVLQPLGRRLAGTAGSMAVRGVGATLSRTGPAVAALTVAVSIGAAVGIMVHSFRASVERWLDSSLAADIYIAAPGAGPRGTGNLETAVIEAVRDVPGIAGASTYLRSDLVDEDGDIGVVAVDLFASHRATFAFLDASSDDAWSVFDDGGVLISEPFASHHDVGAGDTVTLTTDRGPRRFPIAATFRDYSSEFGVIFMSRRTWTTFWNDHGVSSLAIFAAPDVNADTLLERIRRRTASFEGLSLRSDRGLRNATLEVFDRTFAITAVLRSLALLVAFMGVFSALMALQLERGYEIGVLRATGLTPGQVGVLVTSQSALLGLAAGILAVPLAATLAWLLIHVVNHRSFGWSVDMSFNAGDATGAIAIAIGAALLAGVYPAWRLSRTPPAAALRNE